MIEIGIAAFVLAATMAALAARDDESGLRLMWRCIFAPDLRHRLMLMARLAAAQERCIASTRAEADDAQRAGDAERAAQLARAAATYETETREQRQRSSTLRRMLSAIE